MKSQANSNRKQNTSRRASILVCVMVCLAISTALVTSTIHTALTARRSMRTQHFLQQTEILLAAGIQRTVLQVQSSPDYSGEIWKLSPHVIPGIENARVKIDVTAKEEDLPREILVTAQLHITKLIKIQRSYSFNVDPQKFKDKE